MHHASNVGTHTGAIVVGGGSGAGAWSLGTLPFVVVSRLLEAAGRGAAAGRALRRALLAAGAVRLLLACLAVFTHHPPPHANEQEPDVSLYTARHWFGTFVVVSRLLEAAGRGASLHYSILRRFIGTLSGTRFSFYKGGVISLIGFS